MSAPQHTDHTAHIIPQSSRVRPTWQHADLLSNFNVALDFTLVAKNPQYIEAKDASGTFGVGYDLRTRAYKVNLRPEADQSRFYPEDDTLAALSEAAATISEMRSSHTEKSRSPQSQEFEKAESKSSFDVTVNAYSPSQFPRALDLASSSGGRLPLKGEDPGDVFTEVERQVSRPGPVRRCPCDDCTYYKVWDSEDAQLHSRWVPTGPKGSLRVTSEWRSPTQFCDPNESLYPVLAKRRKAFESTINSAAEQWYKQDASRRARASIMTDDHVRRAVKEAKSSLLPVTVDGFLSADDDLSEV